MSHNWSLKGLREWLKATAPSHEKKEGNEATKTFRKKYPLSTTKQFL